MRGFVERTEREAIVAENGTHSIPEPHRVFRSSAFNH
jgi:hypothetical protein